LSRKFYTHIRASDREIGSTIEELRTNRADAVLHGCRRIRIDIIQTRLGSIVSHSWTARWAAVEFTGFGEGCGCLLRGPWKTKNISK
jgi:hypothetical protein